MKTQSMSSSTLKSRRYSTVGPLHLILAGLIYHPRKSIWPNCPFVDDSLYRAFSTFPSLQVVLKLQKTREEKENPFLVLHVAHLGINTKVRKYDMDATTYIKKITMKCLEFAGRFQFPSLKCMPPYTLLFLLLHLHVCGIFS